MGCVKKPLQPTVALLPYLDNQPLLLQQQEILQVPSTSVVQFKNIEEKVAAHNEICSICLQEFTEDSNVFLHMDCNKLFHEGCINQWLSSTRVTCPLCRKNILIK